MAPIFLPLNYTILQRYKRKMSMKYKHDSLSWSIHMDTLECCKGIALHLPKRVNRSCSRPEAVTTMFSGPIRFYQFSYSKTCLKQPLSKRPKMGFQDQLLLNAGQKYCRMQYFRPALSYHMPLRPLFCLFLSGHLRQVLLYITTTYSQLILQAVIG